VPERTVAPGGSLVRPRATTRRHVATRAPALLAALALLLVSSTPARGDFHPKPEIARGKLLIASDQLLDPNFAETVVLLLEYAPEGALGVIINRPTDVKLAELLPEVEQLRGRDDNAFLGGPVARNRMILLLRSKTPPASSARVVDGVFITSSLDALRDLPRDPHAAPGLRAYVGYAAWGPQQLDAEVAHGDWHVLPADAATLFDRPPAKLWSDLNERASGEWVRAPTPRTPALAAAAGAQLSSGGVALPPAARNACRAATLAFTS
jgi:putative transcriptional regulator